MLKYTPNTLGKIMADSRESATCSKILSNSEPGAVAGTRNMRGSAIAMSCAKNPVATAMTLAKGKFDCAYCLRESTLAAFNHFVFLTLLCVGAVFLHGCGGGGGRPSSGSTGNANQTHSTEAVIINVAPTTLKLVAGQRHKLSADAVDANGTIIPNLPISWSVENSVVGTINADGTIMANVPGITRIFASSGKLKSKPVELTVWDGITGPKTSTQLIEQAERAGQISSEQSLMFRVMAAYDRPALPSEYLGDDSGVVRSGVTQEAKTRMSALSAPIQQAIKPYLKSGTERIAEAGELNVPQASYDGPANGAAPTTDTTSRMVCTAQGWEQRVVSNQPHVNLNLDPALYGGGIYQGKYVAMGGPLAPVTIPRGPGKLIFQGPFGFGNAPVTKDVPVMDQASVEQERVDMVRNIVAGGVTTPQDVVANFSKVDSEAQLLIDLGVSAKVGKGKFAASFSNDSTRRKTHLAARFQQTLYRITYQAPESAVSVFAGGEEFTDPDRLIGPGNPPMYVSQIDFGVLSLLIAESDFDEQTTKASLEAALKGGSVDVEVKAGLKHSDVLRKTTITFYTLGGTSRFVSQLLGGEPSQLYQRYQELLRDPSFYQLSAENPGMPISYQLNYLHNRAPVSVEYTADYTKQNCAFRERQIRLLLNGIDDYAEVWINDTKILQADAFAPGYLHVPTEYSELGPQNIGPRSDAELNLNQYLKWFEQRRPWEKVPLTVRVVLYNGGCYRTHLGMTLLVDGSVPTPLADFQRDYDHNYFLNCGKTNLQWVYSINPYDEFPIRRIDHFDDARDAIS